MKPSMDRACGVSISVQRSYRAAAMLAALATVSLQPAQAQSFCASDGQPRPAQLVERFINADCDHCWADPATPATGPRQLALDWVLPGSRGDDAPLSAVASRDALARLAALGKPAPVTISISRRRVQGLRGASLRVAQGLPLADYLGVSIELKPIPAAAQGQRWTSWLVLVETLPAGTEGSPVKRNLVRNLLQTEWNGGKPALPGEPNRFFESRAMSLAAGATPERLRLVGWVENEKGQILDAAQSRCEASSVRP